ncbi:hypothetical protein K0B04_01265 [Patescibacteria group bacterium]|nr:hypothetical protein [Patescibacteria group bacterium]
MKSKLWILFNLGLLVLFSIIVAILIVYLYFNFTQKPYSLVLKQASIEDCLEKIYTEIPNEEKYQIKLQSRTFTPKENREDAEKCLWNNSSTKSYYLFLQLYDVPTNELKEELNAMGIYLHDYLPNNTWFADFRGKQPILPQQIRWVGAIKSEDKISPELWEGNIGSWALDGNNVLLRIRTHEGVSKEIIETVLENSSAKLLDELENYNLYTVRIDKAKIKDLAKVNEISYIDTIPPPPTTDIVE